MGDVDRRRTDPLLEFLELFTRGSTQLRIKIGERLIQQKDRGLTNNCPGKRHTLPFASRKLSRLAIKQFADTEQRRRPVDFLLVQLFLHLLGLQWKRDILKDRKVRVKGIALEDHRDAALAWRQMVYDCASDQDLASRRLLESSDHAQQRGLSRAGRSKKHQELAFASLQAHIVDCPGLALFENLRQTSGFNNRHRRPGYAFFHLSKMRFTSFSAAEAAFSGVISSRATLANMVGMTNVLKTSSTAAVA